MPLMGAGTLVVWNPNDQTARVDVEGDEYILPERSLLNRSGAYKGRALTIVNPSDLDLAVEHRLDPHRTKGWVPPTRRRLLRRAEPNDEELEAGAPADTTADAFAAPTGVAEGGAPMADGAADGG